jgi:hypothetical protein
LNPEIRGAASPAACPPTILFCSSYGASCVLTALVRLVLPTIPTCAPAIRPAPLANDIVTAGLVLAELV